MRIKEAINRVLKNLRIFRNWRFIRIISRCSDDINDDDDTEETDGPSGDVNL